MRAIFFVNYDWHWHKFFFHSSQLMWMVFFFCGFWHNFLLCVFCVSLDLSHISGANCGQKVLKIICAPTKFNNITLLLRTKPNENQFHVKLNKIRFYAGDLSLFTQNFKGNFGYQSSNICINTVIKFTWNHFSPFSRM